MFASLQGEVVALGAGPSGRASWATGEGGLRVALTLCALLTDLN